MLTGQYFGYYSLACTVTRALLPMFVSLLLQLVGRHQSVGSTKLASGNYAWFQPLICIRHSARSAPSMTA